MSAPGSSSRRDAPGAPALFSLTLGVVVGPIAALINQQAIYASTMWVCGRGFHGALHIVPALCLIVAGGAAVGAFLNWREVGRGVEDEQPGRDTRSRFLALTGMALSVFSMVVILAQWFAIAMFDPCMRA